MKIVDILEGQFKDLDITKQERGYLYYTIMINNHSTDRYLNANNTLFNHKTYRVKAKSNRDAINKALYRYATDFVKKFNLTIPVNILKSRISKDKNITTEITNIE